MVSKTPSTSSDEANATADERWFLRRQFLEIDYGTFYFYLWGLIMFGV